MNFFALSMCVSIAPNQCHFLFLISWYLHTSPTWTLYNLIQKIVAYKLCWKLA